MNKHTEGPWGWYSEDGSMATLCGYTKNGHLDPFEGHVLSVTICKSCRGDQKHWQWGKCYTASAADARLIAAAPDLLAALKAVLSDFCDHDALIAAREVVEKAEGLDEVAEQGTAKP